MKKEVIRLTNGQCFTMGVIVLILISLFFMITGWSDTKKAETDFYSTEVVEAFMKYDLTDKIQRKACLSWLKSLVPEIHQANWSTGGFGQQFRGVDHRFYLYQQLNAMTLLVIANEGFK